MTQEEILKELRRIQGLLAARPVAPEATKDAAAALEALIIRLEHDIPGG